MSQQVSVSTTICSQCVRPSRAHTRDPLVPPPALFTCRHHGTEAAPTGHVVSEGDDLEGVFIPPPVEFSSDVESGEGIIPPPKNFQGSHLSLDTTCGPEVSQGIASGPKGQQLYGQGMALNSEDPQPGLGGTRVSQTLTLDTKSVSKTVTTTSQSSSTYRKGSEDNPLTEQVTREELHQVVECKSLGDNRVQGRGGRIIKSTARWQISTVNNNNNNEHRKSVSTYSSSTSESSSSSGSSESTSDGSHEIQSVRKCSSESVISTSGPSSPLVTKSSSECRIEEGLRCVDQADVNVVECETRTHRILDKNGEHIGRVFKLTLVPATESAQRVVISSSAASSQALSSPSAASSPAVSSPTTSSPAASSPAASSPAASSPTTCSLAIKKVSSEESAKDVTGAKQPAANIHNTSATIKLSPPDRVEDKSNLDMKVIKVQPGPQSADVDTSTQSKPDSSPRQQFFKNFGGASNSQNSNTTENSTNQETNNSHATNGKLLNDYSKLNSDCDQVLNGGRPRPRSKPDGCALRTESVDLGAVSESPRKPSDRRSQIDLSQEICRQLFPKNKNNEFFFGKDCGNERFHSSLFSDFIGRDYRLQDNSKSSSKTGRLRSYSGGNHSHSLGDTVMYPIEIQTDGLTSKPCCSSAGDDAVKQAERKEETVHIERPLSFILPDSRLVRRRSQDHFALGQMRPCEIDSSTFTMTSSGGSNTSAPVSPAQKPRPGSAAANQSVHMGFAPLATADSSSEYLSSHSRQSSMDSRFGLSCSPTMSSSASRGVTSPTSGTSSASSHFVVVAIDFGTTYSGYAFSFTRDPESIHMMRRWEGGDPGIVNQKTPTTLLLMPDGQFHSFGFTARDFYHDLEAQESKKWLYFEKFKMALHHNADLTKDTIIKSSSGKPYSALTVFSHALRFFKEHALQELSDQSSTTILNEDIRWVITVPAIWKAPAKQFMRQASYMAGIASPATPSQLLIALEPEAASIYVRKLRLYQLVPESTGCIFTEQSPQLSCRSGSSSRREQTPDPISSSHSDDGSSRVKVSQKYRTLPAGHFSSHPCLFPMSTTTTVGQQVDKEGTRYMVVDCGGGTVDITVYEMESKYGHLKELHKATGGPYGSLGVDLEFEKLLVAIFGAEFLEAFKAKRPAGWVDLMTAFESRKRTASPLKNNSLNVSLPFSFIDYYKKSKGSHVEAAIRKYGNKEVCWSSQGMLRLTTEAMRRLFQPTLDHIKQAIGDVLNCPTARDIEFMFLVGGFSESPILQLEMRKEFGNLLKIIIPQDVGLTILKGAVCFGLDPTVVSVRRSRLTYGVGVLNRFVPSKHPSSKLVTKQGVDWCMDVFDKYVEVDQSVAIGDTVIRSYTPAKIGQKSSIIHIYCTDRPRVEYITEPGVKRCGTLCLDLTDVQYRQPISAESGTGVNKRREIHTMMTFGDTEIKVTALDVSTGKCVRADIDFLNK